MPYVIPPHRNPIDDAVDSIPFMEHGDLTYAITRLMVAYAGFHGTAKTPRYTVLSQARSAAQDAADEWYRRVMAPFEDAKRDDNGDVFPVMEKP